MLRLFVERVLPQPKEAPINIGPLSMGTLEELSQAHGKVIQALASGQLTVTQAEQICAMIDSVRRLLETQNLERRVRFMEQLLGSEEPEKAA